MVERLMQRVGRRRNMFQIAEEAAWLEQIEDLLVESSLALVVYMVDRKA